MKLQLENETLNGLKYLVYLVILIGCTNQATKDNVTETYDKRDFNVTFIKDENEVINFDLNVYYLREGSTDTVHIRSASNRISVPTNDSTIRFFRVRCNEYSIDFSGLFLEYELPTFFRPGVSNWYFLVDTPPFRGQAKYADMETVRHVLGLYADSLFGSGVNVPVRTIYETNR